jgi:hypothetical protein
MRLRWNALRLLTRSSETARSNYREGQELLHIWLFIAGGESNASSRQLTPLARASADAFTGRVRPAAYVFIPPNRTAKAST